MPDPRVVADALSKTRSAVFWLDEAPRRHRHASLAGGTTADLTIVGGGYLGLWSAVHAKRRNPGQRVVLLEAHELGWAASGRNGGFCEASITHGAENARSRWPDEFDRLEELGLANLADFERDVRDLRLDCHWDRSGMLTAAIEPHQLEWLTDSPHRLSAEETRSRVNSPLFLGGAFAPDNALVQPARLTYELARVAASLGVEIFEGSRVESIETPKVGPVQVRTAGGYVTSDRVILATNVFRSVLRRNRMMTIPVYDYALMTEPLSTDQMSQLGWAGREGLTDMANQFHYVRLSADNRILFGGYDAIYSGLAVKESMLDRPETYKTLASHFFAMFPQLADVRFTHQWGGAIDTCTQFTAFYGMARGDRIAYASGFTGLGVGATRFAAQVLLDKLDGLDTERTRLTMVRKRPLPFPPAPVRGIGIGLTKWSLDRADHRQGRRNLLLRTLDRLGLGFDS